MFRLLTLTVLFLGLTITAHADDSSSSSSSSSGSSSSGSSGGGGGFGGGGGGGGTPTPTPPPTPPLPPPTTTPAPPVCPDCNIDCECSKDLDVIFVIDTTASLSASDLQKYKDFIKDVIGELDYGDVRSLGLDMTGSQLWSFADSRQSVCYEIDNLATNGVDRDTASALIAAENVVNNLARPRIQALRSVVVITYGLSIDNAAVQVAAAALHVLEVPICVVTIGNSASQEAEAADMTGPTEAPILVYGVNGLASVVGATVRCLCSLPTGLGTISGGLFVTDLITLNIALVEPPSTVKVILEAPNFPSGVDFDPDTGFLFWTGYFPERLYRTEVTPDALERPGTRRRLDSFSGLLTSERVRIDHNRKQIVVSVWTEAIYRMNFDGSKKEVIVQGADLHCHGFVIDEADDAIVYADFAANKIYKSTFSGTDQPLPKALIGITFDFPSGSTFFTIEQSTLECENGATLGCSSIQNPFEGTARYVVWLNYFGGITRLRLHPLLKVPESVQVPDPTNFDQTDGIDIIEGGNAFLFTDRRRGGIQKKSGNLPSQLITDQDLFRWPFDLKTVNYG